jgi:PKD repeat protein
MVSKTIKTQLALCFLFLLLGFGIARAQCIAAFQSTQPQCPTVSFFDGSTSTAGPVTIWAWNFGDGATSTVQNPTHTYANNGTYQVCLQITSLFGCMSVPFCQNVTISCIQPANCQAGFQFTTGQCPTVLFSDASTTNWGPITSWAWSFGDGGTSNVSSPTHTYTANGSYQVCLSITTTQGCTSTVCQTINITCIQPQCNSQFGVNLNGCPQILFTDQSTPLNGISAWSWNFGDGGTSTAQNPAHTYLVNGTYVVCLTVTTPNQCTNTSCDTIVINCNGNQCQAAFQYSTVQCPTIAFTDFSTPGPGTFINSRSWTFGDGGTSTATNPTHTYAANGSYQVCLTVTTTSGCTSTVCQTVNITCIQPQCHSQFGVNLNGCPQILFTDQSTPLNGISAWSWNFGDGGTSTAQNPAHTYLVNGTYVVCLTVTTPNQCTNTSCDTIVIGCNSGQCQAIFQYSTVQCPTIAFTDFSAAGSGTIINSRSWTFGDGGTSTATNPTHTYTANGSYPVCLTITTTSGCTSTVCQTVNITCIQPPACQAAFGVNLNGCPQILFTDQSTPLNGISSWSWTFGDGSAGTGPNPTHTYLVNGTYVVCLTIATPNNCTSTTCDTIVINCNPTGGCVAAFTNQSTPNLVSYFVDQSTSTSGAITSWLWTFGDGSTSNLQNPMHVYATPGNYMVCLTIYTATQCSDSTCHSVTIGTVGNAQPHQLSHFQCAPNPFGDQFRIEYGLAEATPVQLALFDGQGRLVRVLHNGNQASGDHALQVDAADLAKGIYLLRLRTEGQSRSLLVLRQ